MNACRNWWFDRDQFFHLRRQDGVVHLQQPGQHLPQRRETSVVLNQLSLLTYNCQSLGEEIAEDMHTLGVTEAALQGTRWKSGDPRSEWIVYNRDGHA